MLPLGLIFVALLKTSAMVMPKPTPTLSQLSPMPSATIQTLQLLKTSGPMAKRGDRVTIHYRIEASGSLISDTATTGLPFQFVIGDQRVPAFLSLGAEGLSERSTRIFIVPAGLAGGDQGKPPLMPPKQDLRVTVRLVTLTAVE